MTLLSVIIMFGWFYRKGNTADLGKNWGSIKNNIRQPIK
jgi:hypothetical protein